MSQNPDQTTGCNCPAGRCLAEEAADIGQRGYLCTKSPTASQTAKAKQQEAALKKKEDEDEWLTRRFETTERT